MVRTAEGGNDFQEEKRARFSKNCSIKCWVDDSEKRGCTTLFRGRTAA
jgi:hypothetical protein